MKKQPEITEATRQRIVDAFWSLFSRFDIEKITVNQLSAEAHIHRSSFYRYFSDVYSVLELFEEQVLKAICEETGFAREKSLSRDFRQYADSITEVFSKYADKLYCLFHGSCANQFKRLFTESLQEEIKKMYGLPDSMEDVDYYATLMGTVFMTNITYWYEHREQYTFQEINAKAQNILSDGLKKIQNSIKNFPC